jgi:dynein heavy chain
LSAAIPFLKKAEEAASSIKGGDIAELKGLRTAKHIIKIIFETVQILFQGPLVPVQYNEIEVLKGKWPFIQDSYDEHVKQLLTGPLLQSLLTFSKEEKNLITPETVELLAPFLDLKTTEPEPRGIFEPEVAGGVSKAMQGMCTWARAMRDYHIQSRIVAPKLKMLESKTVALEKAQNRLAQFNAELDAVNQLKANLRAKFDDEVAKKNALADRAAKTKKRMDQANRLINSLADNKVRWLGKKEVFATTKKELVGNVAKACAFVSYCGPFNAEFRNKIANVLFQNDLVSRNIPATEGLELTEFLVDKATVGEWQLQGLPNDDLSI